MKYLRQAGSSYYNFFISCSLFIGLWLPPTYAATQKSDSPLVAAITLQEKQEGTYGKIEASDNEAKGGKAEQDTEHLYSFGLPEADPEESDAHESLPEPPKNPFKWLPEDLYPVIASFLEDEELRGLICSCKAFNRVQSFFRQAEWKEFSRPTYRLISDGLAAWGQGPTYVGRKTLYIKHRYEAAEGSTYFEAYQEGKAPNTPYLESRVLQKSLTGLVLYFRDRFLQVKGGVRFPQLTRLKVVAAGFKEGDLAALGLMHCTNLHTLYLHAVDNNDEIYPEWLGRLTELRELKLINPFALLPGAENLLALQVLWLYFLHTTDKAMRCKEFFHFLDTCTQLQEIRIQNLLFTSSKAGQEVIQKIGRLNALHTLELKKIGFWQGTAPCRIDVSLIDWSAFIHLKVLCLDRVAVHNTLVPFTDTPLGQRVLNLAALHKLLWLQVSECARLVCCDLGEGLPALEKLDCGGCKALSRITGLTGCTHLAVLWLPQCQALESIPISEPGIPPLEVVDCTGCTQLKDLSGLSSCHHLRVLTLKSCTALEKCNLGGGLAALQKLDCTGCTRLSDITPLAHCTSLVSLNLNQCTALDAQAQKNLAVLAQLPLQELNLGGWQQLKSLEVLTAWKETLRRLDCSDCTNLEDINALPTFSHLTSLSVSGFRALERNSAHNLELINQLPLEELSLGYWGRRGFSSLQPLARCGLTLRRLNCSGCEGLADISSVRDFPRLEELKLSYCDYMTRQSKALLRYELPKRMKLDLPLPLAQELDGGEW